MRYSYKYKTDVVDHAKGLFDAHGLTINLGQLAMYTSFVYAYLHHTIQQLARNKSTASPVSLEEFVNSAYFKRVFKDILRGIVPMCIDYSVIISNYPQARTDIILLQLDNSLARALKMIEADFVNTIQAKVVYHNK